MYDVVLWCPGWYGEVVVSELKRVRQDARQHRAFDVLRHVRCVLAHQIMHDRGGAGDGAHGNVDRAFGLQPADQLVVVDDLTNIGAVDRGR